MNWYIDVFKKYNVFDGRSGRKEYWYFFLFNIIIGLFLAVIDRATGTFSPDARIGLLGAIFMLAVLISGIAVSVRRLHDIDRSGWWLLIGLIPFIGAIVLLLFMVQDSKPGQNKYGVNPKSAAS
ncbi:DUF805 domain-containing protein [Thiorhodovibrio frisius]|uniref:Putative membrane protein n=1 Tax=Thiorhodovibrio frisius TaxID=631362 RepID=H8Z4G7_9GAMM|nr:DUF805 domain-containing protein [Thiorhodovibrio frisius]EIC20224.1 putative membrane protein [Thiorhodovibrio frisius]WPL20961.1 Inner membrane protein YhaH [Thiorhodovibrio frisius]